MALSALSLERLFFSATDRRSQGLPAPMAIMRQSLIMALVTTAAISGLTAMALPLTAYTTVYAHDGSVRPITGAVTFTRQTIETIGERGLPMPPCLSEGQVALGLLQGPSVRRRGRGVSLLTGRGLRMAFYGGDGISPTCSSAIPAPVIVSESPTSLGQRVGQQKRGTFIGAVTERSSSRRACLSERRGHGITRHGMR